MAEPGNVPTAQQALLPLIDRGATRLRAIGEYTAAMEVEVGSEQHHAAQASH